MTEKRAKNRQTNRAPPAGVRADSPDQTAGGLSDDEIAAPPTSAELAEIERLAGGPSRRFDAMICDIDGCIVPESAEPFDIGAIRGIADHNRAAIKTGELPVLTLCSGRPQPFVEAVCRLVGNTLLPCIAENGVWLYFPSTNEYQRDPTITRDHIQAVREASDWVEAELFPRGFSIQPGKTASISLFHPDPGQLAPAMPEIQEAFRKEGWPLRVSRTWYYINCDLDHISKATGLDWLIASSGLNPDRLAGFGDTESDLAIAQRVKYFACPPRHEDSVGRVAHHISPYWQAWAVLDVLERVLAE
ncbi:MAG: HAD hydrolase family protein [Phycisphaeraceae bacterium]|nr:HAD hydrolase family protein [Phycisphaerae bacterium]MBX3392343.1 HAD hydrolase family protein [Phycisphaeraceae bacterium]